jgi:hypothetical protein
MITLTLEAVLGVMLAIVIMQFFKKHPEPAATAAPVEDLANLKPQDARVGDAISISGAGDNMEDLDYTVDRTTWLTAGSRQWVEIAGPYKERRVALRVGGDEEVEVSIHNDPRKVTLEDLGLSEDDLAQMDERQNTADSFEFDGKTWLYVISREVQARRSDRPQADGFYYWEFREQSNTGIMGVRKEQSEPFSVTLFTVIQPGDVTVYRGRAS